MTMEMALKEKLDEGISQGISQGIKKAHKDDAIKMLKKNMPLTEIVDITGLSKEEIFSLKGSPSADNI